MLDEKEYKEVEKTPDGLLAHLWRRIVVENDLHGVLKYYLDLYKKSGGRKSAATIQSLFTAPKISWKNFVFLITEILPVKKFRLIIEVEFKDGTKSSHYVDVYKPTDDTKENTDVKKDNKENK